MLRELPDRPNLTFLKKQAKELLRQTPHSRLADVQRTLANEYGFPTWARLKSHVESLGQSPAGALKTAVCNSDAQRVREILASSPELRRHIDDPMPGYAFGIQPLFAAVQRTDRLTIDVLLDAGADIRKRTDWWAGGFGVLDECDPSLLDFLIERGAALDPHSAARLGLLGELKAMLEADSAAVHARGGDGQTPLHFASTVEVAELLLKFGADMDARDIDHESTPAQYMLRVEHKRHYPHDRQNVARYLVSRGCQTDILMASALGDADLVRRHLKGDPECIRMCVDQHWFPKRNERSGGSIYIWVLGPNRTAHAVARDFGHEEIFHLLLDHTPEDLKLSLACELGDEASFRRLLAAEPHLAKHLTEEMARKLPLAAQQNNEPAVRLMLEAGWPVNTPGEMGATALHWAAFHGNAAIVEEILKFHPDVEKKSKEYAGSPLSWAIFGSGNSWRRDTGDYVRTVRLLLNAGASVPSNAEELEPSDAVLEILP